ncbi:MAG: EAL domain-containing protein [Methylobacter sp.]|nr:EAL domain-containing protein [Methylobacter sp.]
MAKKLTPLVIALLYAGFSGFWIVASGYLLAVTVDDPLLQSRIELVKGLVFVAVTSILLYLMLKGWRESLSEVTILRENETSPFSNVRIILVFIVLILIGSLIGLAIDKLHRPQIEREAYANLEAIARLKAEQIENWLAARYGDSITLAASNGFAAQVDDLAHQRDKSHQFKDILDRLNSLRTAYGYDSVLLLNTDSRLLISVGKQKEVSNALQNLLLSSFSSKKIQRSDLYRDKSGHIFLDWVVPIIISTSQEQRVVAAVVLRVVPEQFIFPLIQTWPSASQSAETMLVRRENNLVVYLNELRHRSGTALTLKLPLSDPALPAAAALQEEKAGILSGRDYRGISVLSAYRPVAGTQWRIIAKIDRNEVMAPLRLLVSWVNLIAFFAIAVISVMLLLMHQQRRSQSLAILVEKTKANHLLRYFYDLPFIGMAIISPSSNRWVQFNDRLCAILGYAREELVEMNWMQVTHPEDLETDLAELQTVLSGESEGYIFDKRYIRKDGGLVFTTSDIKCIRKADGTVDYIAATIEDITERKASDAKIQRLTQLYAALSQCNQAIVRYTSEEELFPHICRDAVQFGGMKMASISRIDPETYMVELVARFGAGSEYLQEKKVSVDIDSPFGGGPTGTAIRENQPYWCQDFLNDPAAAPWQETAQRLGWRAWASLPIYKNGAAIGVFSVYSSEINAFGEAEQDLLIEMARDISFGLDNFDREAKRKKTEESLQKSEQRLRTIIETEPECVKILDCDGKLLEMNAAGLAILQANSLEEIQHHKLVNFILPEYRDSFIALHNQVMGGKNGILEYEIIGLRGQRRWLEVHATALRDSPGEAPKLLEIARDVTARKQAELALKESELRLSLIIKGSNDASWDWDIIRDQMYYSPQWSHMLGYTVDEPAGNSGLWRQLLHADDIVATERILNDALMSEQESYAVEFRLQHKDGHYVPVLSRGFITRDESGKPVRVSGANMDLTEQNRAQQMEEVRSFLLECVARNISLEEILEDVVLKLERLKPGTLCSILLLDKDGRHLRNTAAPSLPDFYNQAVDGLQIGDGVGSCGTAAFTGKRVIVENIASHPYWTAYKTMMAKAGLASCWSQPIISSNNKVIGTFAIYHRLPALPDNNDIALVEMTAHLLSIAIERKRAEAQLKLTAKVFEQSNEGFMITDANRNIIMVNHGFTVISGYSEAEVLGRNLSILFSGHHDEDFFRAMWESIDTDGHWHGEIWNRRKNGEVHPDLLSISSVSDDSGKTTEYVGIFADITQIKASEAQLEFLAHHDPLTSLPNRLRLFFRLEHGLEMAKREGRQLALLMLDLDRFKDINDSFGHLAGDQLLQLVAKRLTARLRDVDTVARLGGDEFTVLLEDIAHVEDAARVAEEIIADLSEPWHLPQSGEVRIGLSIGISLYPQHGDTPEILLQQADAALYLAKEGGRNRFAYFSDELTRGARERIELEGRLRRAIAQNELRVYYQPQVNIASGLIVGAEALVRWQDPVEGLIPPNRFIPVAEQTGLIMAIGEWVLRETCRQGREWMDAGLPSLTLAVNVSPHQLRQGDISALVATVLRETAFPAERLELELTESGLMERETEAVELLNSLRAQGIRLAIDDFGTGYSSLAYLKLFPLDVLKIDKSFINDIPHSQDDIEIAATIIAMGHILGFRVLAEGVETVEQLDFLQAQGCDLYQGYLKSRALPADDFAALIKADLLSNCRSYQN